MKYICSECQGLMDAPAEVIVYEVDHNLYLCKDCTDKFLIKQKSAKDLNSSGVIG